ncbi:MAG: exodeoxyribonuclease VII large subunit [Saprospiraceae bacterium]|nr:exodeoxyribonuclease VII large subunit [Saprospiraceae bacterium]
MDSIRLSRLNELIRRAIALNFSQPLWITAEVVQLKINKGHYYLELAERTDTDEIIAQSSAVIWKMNFLKIQSESLLNILKEGNELKLKVDIDFHIRFGLKLNILEIDLNYTLGQIKLYRQKVISKLIEKGLWQKNKKTILPAVIKNIAIITSLTAAGKEDFEEHLKDNPYGYTFIVHLYPSSMQGTSSKTEVVSALQKVVAQIDCKYDCIAILRGGGAKLDLADFDHFEISKIIAEIEIPVLTGIGHFQDESIADMNAFQSLKTPTAVADFIIQYNNSYEIKIKKLHSEIINVIQEKINAKYHYLNSYRIKRASYLSNIQIIRKTELINFQNEARHVFQTILHNKSLEIQKLSYLIDSNNPFKILSKGFSINFQSGKRVKNLKQINTSLELLTMFEDGILKSKIES